jgi:hypothetical protein
MEYGMSRGSDGGNGQSWRDVTLTRRVLSCIVNVGTGGRFVWMTFRG